MTCVIGITVGSLEETEYMRSKSEIRKTLLEWIWQLNRKWVTVQGLKTNDKTLIYYLEFTDYLYQKAGNYFPSVLWSCFAKSLIQ